MSKKKITQAEWEKSSMDKKADKKGMKAYDAKMEKKIMGKTSTRGR